MSSTRYLSLAFLPLFSCPSSNAFLTTNLSRKFHRLAASEIDVFPYKRGVMLVRNHHHTHHGKSTCSNQYYSHYFPTVLQGSSSNDDESSEYVQNGNNVKPEGSNDDKMAKKVLGKKNESREGVTFLLLCLRVSLPLLSIPQDPIRP